MAINLKNILQLQREVQAQLAAGAPGLKGGTGGCSAAPAPNQERIKPTPAGPICIADCQHTGRPTFVMANRKAEQQMIDQGVAAMQGGAQMETLRYSHRALRKMVIADLTARGVKDPETLDITFDQLGCLCRER